MEMKNHQGEEKPNYYYLWSLYRAKKYYLL